MSVTHTVKDAAARVGLPSRTLRYYDRIGLVSPPRTASGYRVYGPGEEARLRFVRQARALGFSLDEIRELIAVVERGKSAQGVPQIERMLEQKVAAIDVQVTELGAFRERLLALRTGGACGRSDHDAFCGCMNSAPSAVGDSRQGPPPAA